jgi:glyoxylase-like metal-dependent hydrolase (beta-lactamase superfamily II)
MTYRGKVVPGGPAEVRELPHLMISKMSVGDFDNNTYLLRCRSTDEQLLVDAAAEPDRILSLVGDSGLTKIVTTHQHGDHWQALADVASTTGAETYAGADDVDGIPVPTAHPVSDGDTITIGDCELEVIHLVGHTPGSIALTYNAAGPEPHLFTGDCLFPGGVGNTQKDPARFQSLYEGVVAKIFDRLPDTTWVYPGHGGDTTLGAERPHLEEWRERGW